MIRAAAVTVTATLTVAACALTATRPADNNGGTPDTTTTTITVPLAPLPDQHVATVAAPAARHEAIQIVTPPTPPTTVALPTDPEQIIRAVWPDGPDEDYAVLIAWRESGHQPGARNSCCHGLFQLHWTAHRGWLDDFGIYTAADLYDPWKNTRAALALRLRAGWSPWSTHR